MVAAGAGASWWRRAGRGNKRWEAVVEEGMSIWNPAVHPTGGRALVSRRGVLWMMGLAWQRLRLELDDAGSKARMDGALGARQADACGVRGRGQL